MNISSVADVFSFDNEATEFLDDGAALEATITADNR